MYLVSPAKFKSKNLCNLRYETRKMPHQVNKTYCKSKVIDLRHQEQVLARPIGIIMRRSHQASCVVISLLKLEQVF